MNCPKCGLQKFFGIGGYAGPQCMCEVTMPMTPNNANELAELRQQLSEREKQIVMLRESLTTAIEFYVPTTQEKQFLDVLAATQDLSGLRLCYAEPVGKVSGDRQAGMFIVVPHGTPLYEAKDMK